MKKVFLFFSLLFSLVLKAQTDYFVVPGSTNLNLLASWADGSNNPPTNFTTANCWYHVEDNSNSYGLSADWAVSGSNTRVVIGDAFGTSVDFTVGSTQSFSAETLVVKENCTFTLQGTMSSTWVQADEDNAFCKFIKSSGSQTVPTGIYYSLQLSSGSTKVLAGDITITDLLVLQSTVNCGSNTLILGTASSQTGSLSSNGSAIIIGKFKRWYAASTNSGSSGRFPVGVAGIQRIAQINFTSAPSAGGTLTAQFVSGAPGTTGLNLADNTITPNITVDKIADEGCWRITAADGLTGGTYTASLTGTSMAGVLDFTRLRLLKRANSASSWVLDGTAQAGTGSNAVPTVGRTGMTGFSEFSIGGDHTQNPLPVEWMSFTAQEVDDHCNRLEWITASEINNSHFDVQRSYNASEWDQITTIPGRGNSMSPVTYNYMDRDFENKPHIFYRLQQFDLDGKHVYSNLVVLSRENARIPQVNAYQEGASLNIQILSGSDQQMQVTLYDMAGRPVISESYMAREGDNRLRHSVSNLKTGIYILHVKGEGPVVVQKIVLQ